MHILKWSVLLSVFWLLLSGFIQPLLLSFGVISVAIVILLVTRIDKVDRKPKTFRTDHRIFRYVLWLMKEMLTSSIQVTKHIWGSTDKLEPTLAKIPANKVPQDTRVLYANSITLTPGTLSVDLDENELTVHALQKSSIDELKEGGMEKKISSIWGSK